MRVGRFIAAALAAFCLLGATAMAQLVPQPHAAHLARELDVQTAALTREDYALAAGPLTGEAARGAPGRINVRLWAGQDYVFAGVCDANCGDLDLRLDDPMGEVVGAAAGATPVLRVTPQMTGQHAIGVTAPRCRAATCWFAVNVYAR
jgi:hypothetical protein